MSTLAPEKGPSDTISFVHHFKIAASDVKHMMPIQLATVYKYGLVNWHIQISESGGMPPLLLQLIRDDARRDRTYQVTLHPAGQRDNHPPVKSVQFQMRITDAKGKSLMSRLSYTCHPKRSAHRNTGYCTPEQGIFNARLNRVMKGQELFLSHIFIHIQTLIVFDVAEFLAVEYLNQSTARFMPLDLNFRFNLLTNPSTHDFCLKTSTGATFACNKEALYVASPFFRLNLSPNGGGEFRFEDVEHTEAIRVVITWLFTETYHPPVQMTPEVGGEIVKLSERLLQRGPSQRRLLASVERHCGEELIRNAFDRQYVKHMLLVAHTNFSLGGLLESCHAAIISWHYYDVRKELHEHPNPAFLATSAFRRSSALSRLCDNYTKSLTVRCFTGQPMDLSALNEELEVEAVHEETDETSAEKTNWTLWGF